MAQIAMVLVCTPVLAQMPTARVGDVTRVQGQGTNVLMGYGLVTGLEKTGDGSKFLPTMQALAATMERFGARVETLADVQTAQNAAIVLVEVLVPVHGAREGELLDVRVTAVAAKSLAGGRLFSTPLVYHDRTVEGLFAFAQGPLIMDGPTLTAGLIRKGARMERDIFMSVLSSGAELLSLGLRSPWLDSKQTYITLVLDDAHAGWSMAAAVAQAVDKELSMVADVERVALAMDSKNVVVLVPEHQKGDVASWIRDVQATPLLMESNEARVTINRNAGTIVVTGDTRLSPVVISQMGLTVTVVQPSPSETKQRPMIEQLNFVALDAEGNRQPNVRDLLEALNRLKVPFKDRVAILEEVHRAGKLHARLVYEGSS